MKTKNNLHNYIPKIFVAIKNMIITDHVQSSTTLWAIFVELKNKQMVQT